MAPEQPHWDPDSPTKVTCPACEGLEAAAVASCPLCNGVGLVSSQARDVWRRAYPDHRPVVCPACDGNGGHVKPAAATGGWKHHECACCRGATVVPVARAREWRIAHRAGRSNE